MLPFPKKTFDALKTGLVSGKLLNQIWSALRERTPVAGNGILLRDVDGGFEISLADGAFGAATNFCLFYEKAGAWWVPGGVVHAGNKNFSVPDFEITGTTDFKIYIEVPLEANRTDEEDYFEPGIKTSSATTLEMDTTTATNYPDNTPPPVSTGLGELILPIGVVEFNEEDPPAPSFVPTGCGAFHCDQCAGSIFYKPR